MRNGSERAFTLVTADGLRLHALLASPRAPTGVLVLCHGITTDCNEHGQFRALRDRALRSRLAVARFDFRAHGRSEGTNEQLRLHGMRSDVDAVLAMVSEQLGDELPVIPLGVSFGAGAAVHAATSARRCAGLALWYAVVDYERNFGPDSGAPFTKLMLAARSPADPAWSAMPLVGTSYYLPAALVAEMPGDQTRALLERLTVPVIAFQGSRDKLIDIAPLRRVAAEHPTVALRILPGAGHGFLAWRPWVVRRTVSWARRVADARQ